MTSLSKVNAKPTTPNNHDHWLEMRKNNLNSTEVSALFNANPYITIFELWHQKKTKEGKPFEETERMAWGGALEPVIARRAAAELKRLEFPMKDYWQDPDLRIGSSFDFYTLETKKGGDERLMEIKNVDSLIFNKTWEDFGDNDIEAPPHIEIQVQFQMLISGHKQCDLIVLVGGNRLVTLKREANPDMQAKLLEAAAQFWQSIDANQPPEIDYNRDSSFLIDMYGTANDGEVMNVGDSEIGLIEMVGDYIEYKQEIKGLTEKVEALKAQLLERIGTASKVTYRDWSISAGNIEPTEVKAFVKKGYRNFRVTPKKKPVSE